MKVKQIPWAEMFKYTVQIYKISPRDFWDMTMKEFMYLTNIVDNESLINRSDLEHMINNFN